MAQVLTVPPCGVFLTSVGSYCQSETNCTKQVLTNQGKRMFALLTFCKRPHCKWNRQRWERFGLLASCLTNQIKLPFSCTVIPERWHGLEDTKYVCYSLFYVLTSFVLQWCFSLIHQHLEEKTKISTNTITSEFFSAFLSCIDDTERCEQLGQNRNSPTVLFVHLDSVMIFLWPFFRCLPSPYMTNTTLGLCN